MCQPTSHTIHRKLRANVIGNTISLSEETLANSAFTPTGSYGRWLPVVPYGANQPWLPRDMMFEFEVADPDPPALPALSEGMEIYLDDNRSARRYDDDPNDGIEDYSEYYAADPGIPICTTQNGKYANVIHCDADDYILSPEEDAPHPTEADPEFGLPRRSTSRIARRPSTTCSTSQAPSTGRRIRSTSAPSRTHWRAKGPSRRIRTRR